MPLRPQQQNRVYEENGSASQVTLMAFGYQYDAVGKLTGISDWRGRGVGATPKLGLETQHPAEAHTQALKGYHQANFPGTFDSSFAGPIQWNGSDVVSGTTTGWPVGATPSDALFGYDTLYQLTEETREYITANGVDSQLDEDYNTVQERVRALDWKFDPTGSMTEWLDGDDSAGNVASDSFGRALGRIENGYQLNVAANQESCMNALADPGTDEVPVTCYKPEAIYFATNVDDVNDASEPEAGRGTCIWADYDAGGRMTRQVVRTGCLSCARDIIANPPNCPGALEVGTPGQPGYKRLVEAKTITYDYSWNALDQLAGAVKTESDTSEQLVMSYKYDAAGGRVVREKSSAAGGDPYDIRQDLYISGDYERRQVQLKRSDNQNPTTVNDSVFNTGVRGVYDNIDETRLVKYSSGVRIDRDWNSGAFGEEKWFLKFGNHLGSTSVVIDFDTGALVEWSTHYAYGADESHWKNGLEKYNDNEEPYGFTGKEEDEEVGLHYFGARYYSSYLGRWLSPDPPVVHQGGVTNLYNYGGNSPYIYIDPDGAFIQVIVGAVVGFVAGFVSGLIAGDIKSALIGGLVGAVIGAAPGEVGASVAAATGSAIAGVIAGAAVSATVSMAQTMIRTRDQSQVMLSGYVSFATGLISGAMGGALSGLKGAGRALCGYFSNLGISYASAAVTGTLNDETWDDVLLSSSISYWGSYAGNVVGSEIEQAGATDGGVDKGGAGKGGIGKGNGSFERANPAEFDNDPGPTKPYTWRSMYSEEKALYHEVIKSIKAESKTLNDYPLLDNIDKPEIRVLVEMKNRSPEQVREYAFVPKNEDGTPTNIICLGEGAFSGEGVDNAKDWLTRNLVAEFQHTESGMQLIDSDDMIQVQLNDMLDRMGIENRIDRVVHGDPKHKFDFRKGYTPAYKRDGILYSPDKGNWKGWPKF